MHGQRGASGTCRVSCLLWRAAAAHWPSALDVHQLVFAAVSAHTCNSFSR